MPKTQGACSSCQHWRPPSQEYPSDYGECARLSHWQEEQLPARIDTDTEPGDTYFLTKAEFGCTLWEMRHG